MVEEEKNIEQLQEEVIETIPTEPVTEEVKEEVVEEVKEDVPEVKEEPVEEIVAEAEVVEEAPVEEPVEEVVEEVSEEAPVEEAPAEEAEEEVAVEQLEDVELKKDIESTKEELAVVKEVRDELVTLYARYQEVAASKEQLSKDLEVVKSENEQLSAKLQKYVNAEEELNAKLRAEKLSKLSEKFKLLGQDKTVEQLSVKDDETLVEFEKIVDAALEKAADGKEMPSVTVSSQAVSSVSDEEKTSNVEEKQTEAAKPDFFANVCKTLTSEQLSGKKTVKYL